MFFILIEDKGSAAKAISNTMRNVFGLVGVFVWAFAGTCNTMVSNLMGQKKENLVMLAITRIMLLSIGLCTMVCLAVNIFPELFFGLFGQGKEFVDQGIPVLRVVTTGLLFMSRLWEINDRDLFHTPARLSFAGA